jgi:hypothetical protein
MNTIVSELTTWAGTLTLSDVANVGVCAGAIAVAYAFFVAMFEAANLIDNWLMVRSIRRARLAKFKGLHSSAHVRQRTRIRGARMSIVDRAIALKEREERDHD